MTKQHIEDRRHHGYSLCGRFLPEHLNAWTTNLETCLACANVKQKRRDAAEASAQEKEWLDRKCRPSATELRIRRETLDKHLVECTQCTGHLFTAVEEVVVPGTTNQIEYSPRFCAVGVILFNEFAVALRRDAKEG